MTRDELQRIVGPRLALVLDVGEAILPPEQAAAFKRIVKRELGHDGLIADLHARLAGAADGTDRTGTGRTHTGRKGGAP